MAEQKFFKELELGFRELFRILIPGAYAVSLAQVVAPDSAFSQALTRSTASGLAATFFLGLIGYSLRVHERWFPYFWCFERQRAVLNAEIARIAAISGETDNVGFYKYFLETSADDVGDRIHYFSSFYYMLAELSLFSGVAAYAIAARFLFEVTAGVNRTGVGLAGCFIALACIIQLVVLFPLSGIRTKRTRFAVVAGPLLTILALLTMLVPAVWKGALSIQCLTAGIGYLPLILCIISYLFWRLGDKHWKQIVGEQVILVNNRATKLIEASKRYDQTSPSGEPARTTNHNAESPHTNGS
jgi:hypothetical protein